MDSPNEPDFEVECSECGSIVTPVRSLGVRGEWETTYRIDLECPSCESPLGTLPNPSHSEQNVSWSELLEHPEQYYDEG